jgi:iron complex transport system ATP-binding protein
VVSGLEARGLVFDYPGPRRALDGLDLALVPGDLVCLLGPNGSGKSTCLRLFGGVLRATSGTVELDGRALASLRPRARAGAIALVPQALRALPELEVTAFVLGGRYAHLGLFGRARAEDHAAVRAALAEADAADLAGRRLDELSLGQCQRVLIARALAQEAPILLFDEPTAALDPEHQVRTFALIEELVGRGRSALVATHELNLASRFARRIVVLREGRVCATGTAEEVLRREVLEPVYGRDLFFGKGPGGTGRPLVVPWPEGG